MSVQFDLKFGREMGILEGPVVCHLGAVLRSNCVGTSAPLIKITFTKTRNLHSGFWGSNGRLGNTARRCGLSFQPCQKNWSVCCSFSSSSDGNGSIAGNFSENDEEYVNSSVIEAVEVRNGSDCFMIKMHDGRHLRCVHNDPRIGSLPGYTPHPAIVLKLEDGSDLLLPIIVMGMPSALVIAAIRNIQLIRPTIYDVAKEMIEKMGYVVQLVRVTKRVHEAYFAQLFLAKVGGEKKIISFDLRPSDAINMAVRCKAPIQVNRHLAYSDGVRLAEMPKLAVAATASNSSPFTELDRPDGESSYETKEFSLVRNMLTAAVEERYTDAALWRDKLSMLRADKKNRI